MMDTGPQVKNIPRNIDRPNRVPEFVLTYIVCFFGTQLLFESAVMAIVATFLGIYAMYRLTLNRPEGYAYRVLFRFVRFGKMMPSPKFAPRFEI